MPESLPNNNESTPYSDQLPPIDATANLPLEDQAPLPELPEQDTSNPIPTTPETSTDEGWQKVAEEMDSWHPALQKIAKEHLERRGIEISPEHHQEHVDVARPAVPDIDSLSPEQQDLVGEVVEIGEEALIDTDVTIMHEQSEANNGTLESLDAAYAALQQQERREALPDDEIRLRLTPDSTEYQTLQQAGVPQEKLAQGTLTRKELLDAGYAFVNILGGGEKGVINGIVTDPETGEQVDFTGRRLLTHSELAMVYRFQQSQPERYGLQGQDLDEVRKDMLSFVREAVTNAPFGTNQDFTEMLPSNESDMLYYADFHVGTSEDWDTVKTYWDKQIKAYRKEHKEAQGFAPQRAVKEAFTREYLGDLYQLKDEVSERTVAEIFGQKQVRGHFINATPSRQHKLAGNPSPFLESGFRFDENLDANIFLDDNPDQRSANQLRINSATIHLAGAHPDFPGFSEMGGSTDQQYMPTGFWVNNVYPKEATERQKVHQGEQAAATSGRKAEIVIEAQRRLIEVAKQDIAVQRQKRWYQRLRR